MAARRCAGSFSPKTSWRLRVSKVDTRLEMACPLSASISGLDAARREKMPVYEEKHPYWIAKIAFQLIIFAVVNRVCMTVSRHNQA